MSGKLYKHNPVIRGHMTDASDPSVSEENQKIITLDAFEIDLFNAIYYFSQQSLWNRDPDMVDYEVVTLRYSNVKKFLGIRSNDFKTMVIAALSRLLTTEIVFKSYTYESGRTVHNLHVTAISHFAEEVNLDSDAFEVHINPIMSRAIAQHQNNFTIIDMRKTRRLTSKYAKRLYEWLSSMKQLNKKISVDLDTMNTLLGMEESDFKRANKIIKNSYPQLFELLNFEYKYDRTSKKIIFTFNTKTEEEKGE
ncbi:replication initiation protein [Sulfuricurvum sp.]|uniref:replication initiation protein n=1 Tax=Sulfuricurvum sp. TaxID=2025608 RepID=UPI0026076FDF|nr:replication initiation protein [Sulfuricurvum sp.]MDD2267659.1 replication initiation protein [Sulfuricurvum sp.]MDD2784252.1 replication initiation protein [Sulfuricurvum sp.]